jgi:hypothetical protein
MHQAREESRYTAQLQAKTMLSCTCYHEIMIENMVVRLPASVITVPHNLTYRTGFATSNGDISHSKLEQFWFAKTSSNNR